MSSATILSSTSQPDGGTTLSAASAYSLDAVVQAECLNPATPLTTPCLATLLLSGDGGATFVAADTRRFDLLAATTTLTFTLADYADRKFPGTNQWQTVAGTAAAVGVLRTFRPPWTHFQVQTSGNTGGAVTVSAIGDSGALSGGGGGGGTGTTGQVGVFSGTNTITGTNVGLALNQTTKITTTDTPGSTVTFNLATSDYHQVQLGASSTLALSNPTTGQPFTIRLQQAASGGPYTPTWFSGIIWFGTPGYTAPPFPTTASACQKCTFYCTGTNTYDGHWCGNSAS